MSRSAFRGPRRTRVYDCNYNAGEQYYKSALDGLDRKYNAKPSTLDRLTAKSYERSTAMDEDLDNHRRRAGNAIKDDSVFDSRGGRLPRSIVALENEFDEQVNPMSGSLARIRASKKLATMMDDLDLEDTISSVKRKTRIDLGEKLDDDSFGGSSSYRRRGLKMITSDADVSTGGLSKWSALEDVPRPSGASQRALASQARLDDLNSEMFERSEKQAARDKRSAHLKQFLADECDSDNTTSKSLRISSRSEKKIVSF